MDTPDKTLIEYHGGVNSLCRKLGYELKGGLQRVTNWRIRGIPAAVKLDRPDLFGSNVMRKALAWKEEQKAVA